MESGVVCRQIVFTGDFDAVQQWGGAGTFRRNYCDSLSGAKADRAGLKRALASLQPGDTLVVWRLDRLGRSLINLVSLMSELGSRGIEFYSLMENIDTTSAGGRLVFHLMAALAEFERSLISERTRAGMEAAKLRGIHVGRPRRIKPAQDGSLTTKAAS